MRFRLGFQHLSALCVASALMPIAPVRACLADVRAMARTESVACLACHDATVAPDVGLAPSPDHAGPSAEHPVRVSYRDAYARNPRAFHLPEQVERTHTLPAGKVECVTCHRPDAAGGWAVATAGPGRKLCGGCHRQ